MTCLFHENVVNSDFICKKCYNYFLNVNLNTWSFIKSVDRQEIILSKINNISGVNGKSLKYLLLDIF